MAQTLIPMNTIYAVASDFDGTIADTVPTHTRARAEAFKQHGITIDPEMNSYGPRYGATSREVIAGLLVASEILPDTSDSPSDSLVTSILEAKNTLYDSLAMSGFTPMPGAIEFLKSVAGAGKKLALVTAERRDPVLNFFEQNGLLDLFHTQWIITEETIKAERLLPKPAPDSYSLAAKRMEVASPEMMLVVEDSKGGARAGREAGATLLVVNHRHTAEDYGEIAPEFFATELTHVKFS